MKQISHKLIMRNINELIGIINGISYDGIINKLEVARLSSWVKKNRNLSYEHKQAHLISLVEQVLEDGIITDEEREMLLENCSQYTAFETDSIAIVVKEHTAQLDRKKAKQYQQDFKNKKINILSCSTTFEMGIDIGDLETVFMRNVPPSPANYVQRAGRAGRRKDSAAYILTYCGTGSHDYTYFCSPEKMISGVIKPPYFNVVNHKIIVRHLMATCLGFFFRQHPDYFTSIDELVFGNALEEFKNYISSHPSDLNIYINEKILPGDTYRAYHNFKWFDEIEGNDEKIADMDAWYQRAKKYK